jgi:L-rhamnonate dehydratase
LYWIEEPLSPDNLMGYAELVREVKSTRIASGEHEYTHYGFTDLIRHRAVEVLQPDVSWCGGVTSLRRIAAMADEHDLEFIPHRGGSLYGLPLALSSTKCKWAESFGTGDQGTELMEAMTAPFENGYYLPSDKPGFGTAITEDLVKRHALSG